MSRLAPRVRRPPPARVDVASAGNLGACMRKPSLREKTPNGGRKPEIAGANHGIACENMAAAHLGKLSLPRILASFPSAFEWRGAHHFGTVQRRGSVDVYVQLLRQLLLPPGRVPPLVDTAEKSDSVCQCCGFAKKSQ
jgi:hypothetical protein